MLRQVVSIGQQLERGSEDRGSVGGSSGGGKRGQVTLSFRGRNHESGLANLDATEYGSQRATCCNVRSRCIRDSHSCSVRITLHSEHATQDAPQACTLDVRLRDTAKVELIYQSNGPTRLRPNVFVIGAERTAPR